MNAYYKGQPIFGPRGPAGPDGNPVGTVISYMGLTAPQDYLICDGTVHNISDYPDLANFFAEQFGSPNHFGGDGETTFAVPDMRNLFLRGYHGESEEPLSGNVGEKQEATVSLTATPSRGSGYYYLRTYSASLTNTTLPYPLNIDSTVYDKDTVSMTLQGGNVEKVPEDPEETYKYAAYTSRPVNMAVLYCIKAILSPAALEEYDTEDGWYVRKWSSGYVEMSLRTGITSVTSTTGNGCPFEKLSRLVFPVALVKKYSETAFVCNTNFGSVVQVAALSYPVETPSEESALIKTGSYWVFAGSTFSSILLDASIAVTGRWK